MAIKMAEVVHNSIRELEEGLYGVLNEMQLFVEHCEQACLVPLMAEGSAAARLMTSMGMRLSKMLDQLEKYRLFDSAVDEIAATIMDAEESAADRLKRWMYRTGMTVAEASEKFGRSRSTIYRWIKAGKVAAEKRSRRWIILAA